MATYTDLMSLFNDIGSAINDKGVNGQYYPYQMASAIRSIPTGISVSGTYSVSRAGTFNIASYESVYVPTSSYTITNTLNSSMAQISTHFNMSGYFRNIGGELTPLTLPSTSISTITPLSTSQVAVPQYRWTLNEVVVDAIPSNYIIPSGTSTITTNGTYDITSFASVSVAIPVGDFINNQENVVITPTEEEQIISAAAGYTGLGPVIINGISSTYVGTRIPRPSNSNVTITNSTGVINVDAGYYENGIGKQLSTQAGYSITPLTTSQVAVPSYRWTTGSVIVNAIPISTILSSAIDGHAYLEATNNYAFSATITIPEGYYSTTTITRSFSDVLPSLSTQATAAQIPLGYQVYDGEGHIITGSMPFNASITRTLDSTITSVTIPAGYYTESGLVSHTTVAIPAPSFNFNSTTRVVTASGNWTRGFTTNNSYTNTYTVTAGTVVPPSTITGTSATLTAGTNTLTFSKTISVTPNVTTAGWINAGTASNVVVSLTASVSTRTSNSLTTSGSTVTVPAGYYATQATKNVASATHAVPGLSLNSTTGVITATHTQAAGYVSAGTTSSTLTLTTQAATTITPSTASQTAVAANRYTTGAVTVGPIPSTYKQLSNATTATATDITVGETAYNSDGQLITGELQVITYYTGATVPNSSLGSDGDIYLQG